MSPTDGLLQLCLDVASHLPQGSERAVVQGVHSTLTRPLQVTIGGGVSSGKSTLVNALLGQRVAAVDAGECTRVVTRFCHGHHERAEVLLRDGTSRLLPLEKGAVPTELGVPTADVREVVVHLSNEGLTRVNIVDTPGMNTVTDENESATADFLGLSADDDPGKETAARIGSADALIFLMPHLRQADATILAGFRDLYAGSGLSAFNAVGVLSRIDQLTRNGDPVQAATSIVTRMESQTRGLISQVLPMLGLLAETGATARLTEEDARALAVIATYGDDLDREDLLLSVDGFLFDPGLDVPEPQRRRLLSSLDLYGIATCCALLDTGLRGAAALLPLLVERSGLGPLREVIFGRLGGHAELIKAATAVSDLRRLSYRTVVDPAVGATLGQLRAALEVFEFDPALHQLRVVQVLQDAASGRFRLPGTLLTDLERLAAQADPVLRSGAAGIADVPEAALRGASRWGTFANDPRRSPADAYRARVVKEAYELMWQQASAAAGVPR